MSSPSLHYSSVTCFVSTISLHSLRPSSTPSPIHSVPPIPHASHLTSSLHTSPLFSSVICHILPKSSFIHPSSTSPLPHSLPPTPPPPLTSSTHPFLLLTPSFPSVFHLPHLFPIADIFTALHIRPPTPPPLLRETYNASCCVLLKVAHHSCCLPILPDLLLNVPLHLPFYPYLPPPHPSSLVKKAHNILSWLFSYFLLPLFVSPSCYCFSALSLLFCPISSLSSFSNFSSYFPSRASSSLLLLIYTYPLLLSSTLLPNFAYFFLFLTFHLIFLLILLHPFLLLLFTYLLTFLPLHSSFTFRSLVSVPSTGALTTALSRYHKNNSGVMLKMMTRELCVLLFSLSLPPHSSYSSLL